MKPVLAAMSLLTWFTLWKISFTSVEHDGFSRRVSEFLLVSTIQEETVADIGEDVKNSNEMVEGEDYSTMTWSSTDDAKESRRDATTSDSSLLDGWEGDDIVIDEEDEEEDELDDWEIV